jgi:acetolactate synthase-1/2/3 large subunit
MTSTIEQFKSSKLALEGKPTPAAAAIVDVLQEAGIEMVFGIPGGNMVDSVFEALHRRRSDIRTVLVREESLGSIMAEVHGRLTGRPGVVLGQGAWLLANCGMGALEAYLSSSPMLLLGDLTEAAAFSHHAPYQSGSGNYGSFDARMSLGGMTKRTFVPTEPAQAVQLTQLAIKHATSGEPGPVAVLYPQNTLFADIDPTKVPRTYRTERYLHRDVRGADPDAVQSAVTALTTATRPVIIAGHGTCASRAFSELALLAEAIGAPVATTAGGKSAIEETHELAAGVFGPFGQHVANSVVSEADVLLVVGSKLGVSETAHENPDLIDPERQTLVQIDIEPLHAAWTYPVDHVLLGDARTVLGQLHTAIEAQSAELESARAERRAYLAEVKTRLGFFDEPEGSDDSSPVLPQRIIRDLQRSIDANAVVCCDAGENRIFMTHYFQCKGPGTFVQSAGVGGMGYAIPAALAAKLVRPEGVTVAVCGDGGFAMTMNGLMTAVEEKIPIVVVVMNNAALGWVKHGQAERDSEIASDFHDFDHAAIARAMGCGGIRVESATDLAGALSDAIASGRPTVVDVVTSLTQSFRTVTSPLAG